MKKEMTWEQAYDLRQRLVRQWAADCGELRNMPERDRKRLRQTERILSEAAREELEETKGKI